MKVGVSDDSAIRAAKRDAHRSAKLWSFVMLDGSCVMWSATEYDWSHKHAASMAGFDAYMKGTVQINDTVLRIVITTDDYTKAPALNKTEHEFFQDYADSRGLKLLVQYPGKENNK